MSLLAQIFQTGSELGNATIKFNLLPKVPWYFLKDIQNSVNGTLTFY